MRWRCCRGCRDSAQVERASTAATRVNRQPVGSDRSRFSSEAVVSPQETTDLNLVYECLNAPYPIPITGLNTLLLSASVDSVPDLIGIAGTPSNDDIVEVLGTSGVFVVAAANVGDGVTLTASADTGGATLPLSLSICETDPATFGVPGPTGFGWCSHKDRRGRHANVRRIPVSAVADSVRSRTEPCAGSFH